MSRKLKILLSITLCLIMVAGTVAPMENCISDLLDALTVKASADESGFYCDIEDDDNATITGGPDSGDITIPSEYEGHTVTEISAYSFSGSGISSVYIPKNIEYISDYAFINCGYLSSIEVDPENPYYCSVDGILFNKRKDCLVHYPHAKTASTYTVPDGVKSFGEFAFDSSSSLEKVILPEGVEEINWAAFYGCSYLSEINIPDTVETIGVEAFQYCTSLKAITLPDGLKTIDGDAFNGCTALTSITIPKSVTEMETPFNGCTSLKNISVDSKNKYYFTVDGVLFDRENKALIAYPLGKTDSSYIVPNGVEMIVDEIFRDSEYLTNITIPKSVNFIGHFIMEDTDITDIYYEGSEGDRNSIKMPGEGFNSVLYDAQWHYNCEIDAYNGVDIFTQNNVEPDTETETTKTNSKKKSDSKKKNDKKDDTSKVDETKKIIIIASAAAGIVLLISIIIIAVLLSKKSKKEKEAKNNQAEQRAMPPRQNPNYMSQAQAPRQTTAPAYQQPPQRPPVNQATSNTMPQPTPQPAPQQTADKAPSRIESKFVKHEGPANCDKCTNHAEKCCDFTVTTRGISKTYVLCKNCAVNLKNEIDTHNSKI